VEVDVKVGAGVSLAVGGGTGVSLADGESVGTALAVGAQATRGVGVQVGVGDVK
jgi:hypothetical protein